MKPLAQAIPLALADLLRPMAASPGKIAFAWNAAVGSALQRVTAVRLEGSILIVDAASPEWARAVSQSSRIILSRLETLLGEGTVRELLVRESRT